MNKNKYLVTTLILLGIGSQATAYCNSGQCTNTVKFIYTTGASDGRVHVQLNESMSSLNCSPAEGVYYTLQESHKRFDEIYDTINLAHITGKKVRLRIAEGSQGCNIVYTMLF